MRWFAGISPQPYNISAIKGSNDQLEISVSESAGLPKMPTDNLYSVFLSPTVIRPDTRTLTLTAKSSGVQTDSNSFGVHSETKAIYGPRGQVECQLRSVVSFGQEIVAFRALLANNGSGLIDVRYALYGSMSQLPRGFLDFMPISNISFIPLATKHRSLELLVHNSVVHSLVIPALLYNLGTISPYRGKLPLLVHLLGTESLWLLPEFNMATRQVTKLSGVREYQSSLS